MPKPLVRNVVAPRVSVSVTTKEITTAIPKNSGHCMIADAIKAGVPGATLVSVDIQTIRWTDREKGLRYVYLTPRVAQQALLDFDGGIVVEPFRFSLRTAHVYRSGKKRADDRRAGASLPSQPRLVPMESEGLVPGAMGGDPPPLGALSNSPHRGPKPKAEVKHEDKARRRVQANASRRGARREFGLRSIGR